MNNAGGSSGSGLYGWFVLAAAVALLIAWLWIVFRGQEPERDQGRAAPGTEISHVPG